MESSTIVVTPGPTELTSVTVASHDVDGSSNFNTVMGVAEHDNSSLETSTQAFGQIESSNSEPGPADTVERDIFGSPKSSAAAHMNTFLSEIVPKTIWLLAQESRFENAEEQIHQLRKDGKVRGVAIEGRGIGYIINSDWLKSIQRHPPASADFRIDDSSPPAEPPKNVEPSPLPPQPANGDRDIFGRIPGLGAAHMNTFLSATIPKTARTLMDLSGYQNTTNHLRQLRLEGKVKQVSLSAGQIGWIIDPKWLKSISGSASPGNPPEGKSTRSQTSGSFNPAVRGDATPEQDDTPGTQKKVFRPIGFTAPKSLRRPQQPANLFSPSVTGSESEAKPNNAQSNFASVPRYDLTSSQNKLFEAVASSYATSGISPTIPELQTATSLNRFDTIKEVDALVRKGLFEFDRSSARGIRIIPEAERITSTDRLDAFTELAQPLTSTLPNAITPVAGLAPLSSAKTRERVADVDVPSSRHSPATHADSAQVVPVWLDMLLASDLLDRQFHMAGRRVPPREKIKDFVLLLANQGFAIHRETLCHALELPVIRYAGFLSVVMRLLNVDNVPILTRDDDGEMVRLNVDLLCRQFRIAKL